jgi:hypothetical protein
LFVAHCASDAHAALNLPHCRICIALLAQHCAPPAHCALSKQGAPSGSSVAVPVAGAVATVVTISLLLAVSDFSMPVQKPSSHRLKAQSASEPHCALKFPHAEISIVLLA